MARRLKTKIKNKQKLVPLKEAVDLVSYSKDYVAKLAREKKIKAEQINRQWYVDLKSLKSFEQISDYEKKLRAEELSKQRKLERLAKEKTVELEKRISPKLQNASATAFQFSIAVLLIGVFSGLGLFKFGDFVSPQFSGQLAGLLSPTRDSNSDGKEEFIPLSNSQELAIQDTVSLEPVFEPSVTHEDIVLGEEMVVLVKNNTPVETVEEMTKLFSDEVVVLEGEDGEPRVYAVSNEGEVIGEGLILVSIPVLENANERIQ